MKQELDKEKLLQRSQHFCMIPWTHMHMWPNGNTFLCCVSDSDVPIGNFNQSGLKKLWNSSKVKEARLRLLRDEPLPECRRCYSLERDAKINTLRNQSNLSYGEKFWHLVESTSPAGEVDQMNMAYLDIRFSNICNLRCRSCGPELSSSWLADEAALIGYKRLPPVIQVEEPERLWTELLPLLNQVESVNFAGGEPLLHEEHYKILSHWIKSGHVNHDIAYTTNFTNLKFKEWNALELWPHFSRINLYASLDASGPRAEYMRKGTNWARVLANRQNLADSCPKVKFHITPTVGIFNVWHLPDFLEEWLAKGLVRPDRIATNLITRPTFQDFRFLPQFFLDEICEKYHHTLRRLLETSDWSAEEKQALRRSMLSVVEFANTKKDLPAKFEAIGIDKFLSHTELLDRQRGESFTEVFPELAFLRERKTRAYKWGELWQNHL